MQGPSARIEVVEGDITKQHVDAIVNAANSALAVGGGVCGAIHAAAGPALLDECRRLRSTSLPDGLPVGQAIATGAGELPARWVIHTVGPNRHAGETDPGLLASCFASSLREAVRVGATSVAFPAISAGIYGWDVHEVAAVAATTVAQAPQRADLDLIRFVVLGPTAHRAFLDALGEAPAGRDG